MRKAVLFLALASLATAIVPTGAQASHHCQDVFLLSGTNAATGPAGEKLGGVNIGSATCQVPRNSPDLPNVNYLTPGATHVWVGVLYNNQPNTGAAPTGTITVGASSHTLTFVKNEARGRWESGYYTIGSVTTVKATVTVANPSPGRGSTQTTTYTKLA